MYRLAVSMRLCGLVGNDAAGVFIEVQGKLDDLDRFVGRLWTELPPLASIESLAQREIAPAAHEDRFAIAPSGGGDLADAQVTVDTVVCHDCLRELFDPADRRYRYPFINCTNCGPRYSIALSVPYDRQNTTMSHFAMCPDCRREYTDPADRRYHAQPIACPVCGPKVRLADTRGVEIAAPDPIAAAAEMLRQGKVVAIKGLGGFQIAVDARDEHAVRRLRLRKNRQAKPFALMVRDLAAAESLVRLDDNARQLLAGPRGPIVLLERQDGAAVAPAVAEGTNLLGVMLPTTPLHHLLMSHDTGPLVMTSGNVAEEPLVKDDAGAVAHLAAIADALLLHDRPIERRVDDSVVMADGRGRLVPVRRARGYAPAPLKLGKRKCPPILATGAELKNTFCLYRDGRALVSEHMGDLKDGRVYRQFISTIAHLEKLYGFCPELLACDMHPGYLSTQYGASRARSIGKAATRVQHHHAHMAAVLAEHGREQPVIGIAADGAGYGEDGAVWGCEILLADLAGYRRLGHLRYFPLPGGDLAASETFRPALSVLLETFGEQADAPGLLAPLGVSGRQVHAVIQMLRSGVNCPPSSSLGRLFDACAGLCAVARHNSFEGQAPMALEATAQPAVDDAYEFALSEGQSFEIDYRPMISRLVADLLAGVPTGAIAARCHNTMADFLAASAGRARQLTGVETVAISGGCFANRMMSKRLIRSLEEKGFEVLAHELLPCNDAAVSVGQAVVAAARIGGAAAAMQTAEISVHGKAR